MRVERDAVVIGGGHNGLVAAGFLPRPGSIPSCSRPAPVVGGAAITEQPWGPGWKVTARQLRDEPDADAIVRVSTSSASATPSTRWGRRICGLPDGRALVMSRGPEERFESVAAFSKRDAEA